MLNPDVNHDGLVLTYLIKLYSSDSMDDLSAKLFFERFERSKSLVERDLMQAELDQLRGKPALSAVPKENDVQA